MTDHSSANENASQLRYTKAEVDAAIAAAIKVNFSQKFIHENYKYTTPPLLFANFMIMNDYHQINISKYGKPWWRLISEL